MPDAISTNGARAWIFGAGQKPFEFDAVISETHTAELEVTENPVETGATVSDHAIKKPERLDIELWLTDVDLHGDGSGRGPDDPFGASSSEETSSRSARAYQSILGLQATALPFIVVTGLKVYTNMVITSLSTTQDAATATVLVLRVALREVIRVTTEVVTFPPRKKGKTTHQASKKTNNGEKQAEAADKNKLRSTLKSAGAGDLIEKFIGFVKGEP